jgi:protein-L-isoaspartate(D-aspartate) O-methyltransferase
MDTTAARQQMVEQQIRTWEVLDPRVIDVLERVPREQFVPPQYRELAFVDGPIPIGHGEMMLAPKVHGRILQALSIDHSDKVLEVGTGTGYLTACLSLLSHETASIEIHADFAVLSAQNLRALPAANPKIEVRDAFGAAPLGAYDAVAVTGSLPVYDARFEQALTIGGRLFVIVGVAPVMEALLIRRVDSGEWVRESLFETVIAPLVNAAPAPRFVF